MKVSYFETEDKFKPIEIKIMVESKEELLTLWALANTSDSKLMTNTGGYIDVKNAVESNIVDAKGFRTTVVYNIFDVVDKIAIKLGYKRR